MDNLSVEIRKIVDPFSTDSESLAGFTAPEFPPAPGSLYPYIRFLSVYC
jgi:hypothetical protein